MLKRLFSLSGLVSVLILMSAAGIIYKNTVLRVPLLPDQERGVWLVEARIAYEAKGKPVKVVLALPGEGWEDATEGQQISIGYGYSKGMENELPVGRWSAREPKGRQLIYYRIRLEEGTGLYEFRQPRAAGVPEVQAVNANGARQMALTAISESARQRSADDVTYVAQVQQLIAGKPNDESFSFLQRYYDNKYPDEDAALMMLFSMLFGGLMFRAMLSKFNLLVVPRVAACVVIVTIFMMAVSLLSYKIGAVDGLRVTVFPMIVLAWTIERMSLIWDEEGAISAIYQIGGSLVAAVAAYAMMGIEVARYWVEYFPEVLLILLAIILMLGRYTGYRLTELFRFRNASEMKV